MLEDNIQGECEERSSCRGTEAAFLPRFPFISFRQQVFWLLSLTHSKPQHIFSQCPQPPPKLRLSKVMTQVDTVVKGNVTCKGVFLSLSPSFLLGTVSASVSVSIILSLSPHCHEIHNFLPGCDHRQFLP